MINALTRKFNYVDLVGVGETESYRILCMYVYA
jgi:hypothetical protein